VLGNEVGREKLVDETHIVEVLPHLEDFSPCPSSRPYPNCVSCAGLRNLPTLCRTALYPSGARCH
jgi:hypothetical protein